MIQCRNVELSSAARYSRWDYFCVADLRPVLNSKSLQLDVVAAKLDLKNKAGCCGFSIRYCHCSPYKFMADKMLGTRLSPNTSVFLCQYYSFHATYIYFCVIQAMGIESRWGRDFPHPCRPVLGPIQPPVKCIPGLLSGGKVAGA
jgi:hypothetical protein